MLEAAEAKSPQCCEVEATSEPQDSEEGAAESQHAPPNSLCGSEQDAVEGKDKQANPPRVEPGTTMTLPMPNGEEVAERDQFDRANNNEVEADGVQPTRKREPQNSNEEKTEGVFAKLHDVAD